MCFSKKNSFKEKCRAVKNKECKKRYHKKVNYECFSSMYKYRSVALFWNLALAKSTDFFQDICFKENDNMAVEKNCKRFMRELDKDCKKQSKGRCE